MLIFQRTFLVAFAVLAFVSSATAQSEFRSAWPERAERIWIGPEYWANRLQDWRVSQGRLECTTSGPNRNVHLLTHQLGEQRGGFTMSVRLGSLRASEGQIGDGWAGFRVGAKGYYREYRDSAVYGKGLDVGVTTNGRLFIGNPQNAEADGEPLPLADLELRVSAEPTGKQYRLTLTAVDPTNQKKLSEIERRGIPSDDLVGNVALVCHQNPKSKGNVRLWFCDWNMSGPKLDQHPDQTFGPVLFVQYTISRGVLKMTAQMAPLGQGDSRFATLQIQPKSSPPWMSVGQAEIDDLARTATFRVEAWDASKDIPYRVTYRMLGADGTAGEHHYEGTIRHEPLEQDTIVVAGFTGNNDLGFPNTDVIEQLKIHDPDVLVFTGDQIYERVGGYGVQREPLDMACLDYLRKWYIWGWSYGELTRDRVSICLPDDHDVFHGNLWGAGGKKAEGTGKPGQDSGGYTMPAEFVKMVERTQTSHFPDPYDPTPIKQGIGVYYTAMDYAGISFAIIEDRKFKSPPAALLPEADIINGWAQNRDWDAAKESDVPNAVLLGERQLDFLSDWAGDWQPGTWMKVAVSQTIFANLATLPEGSTGDDVVPKLRIFEPGEYPENDTPVADMDSNGWPASGRDRALRELQRCFAFHLAGDQHLASTIQYGVDEWNDAAYAFCVPAVANIWPRRWFPAEPGKNREPGTPKYMGEFRDGFGNRMTVHAVANPYDSGYEPALLHDRATGYGIVKFNKDDRTITIECWPRYADPSDPSIGGQYPDWPVICHQLDNYGGRDIEFCLPTLEIEGMVDPVVQVIDEKNDEMVYTVRIRGTSFRPRVFKEGSYTLKIGEPSLGNIKTLKGIKSIKPDDKTEIRVEL